MSEESLGGRYALPRDAAMTIVGLVGAYSIVEFGVRPQYRACTRIRLHPPMAPHQALHAVKLKAEPGCVPRIVHYSRLRAGWTTVWITLHSNTATHRIAGTISPASILLCQTASHSLTPWPAAANCVSAASLGNARDHRRALLFLRP